MQELINHFRNMTPQQMNHLLAIFLASVFGSLGTTAFLNWATTGGQVIEWPGRLLLTVVATAIYAVVVFLTFYIVSPESRPALKRIFTRRS